MKARTHIKTSSVVSAMKPHQGFTLVELLVALFITAIIFSMGYGAINQALKDREAMKTSQDRLNAVQGAMRILVQDFSQVAPRPIREPVGDGWQPAMRAQAQQQGQELVTFTRAGWANPAGIQRPGLQRVAYTLDTASGTLRRLHWPVLDSPLSNEPRRRDLLTKVKSVKFRYMDDSRQWREIWPPQIDPSRPDKSLRVRPMAVEVTLELEDWGRIVRIIEVGT
jgi:general secretion pathway protein J